MTGRKKPHSHDPFDIDQNQNFVNPNRKTTERDINTDTSIGEQSSYRQWTKNQGEYDPINPDLIEDGSQPWDFTKPSETSIEQIEALRGLYPSLRGRQKQVVDFLFAGETNQSEIARQLRIDQREVVVHLRRIAKKISEKCM